MFKIPGIDIGAGPKEIQLNPFKWFGGGGGGGTATITQASVQSRQALNIVEVLSEGEIEGFPSAAGLTQGTDAYNKASLKDIFLDKTPIVKSTADSSNITDADFNFQRILFTPRFGTTNQTFIPAISDIETEVGVNAAVTNGAPVTRQITDSNIDAVRVTIRFDALININEKDPATGVNAFWFACYYGHAEVVTLLGQNGADIYAQSNELGINALHLAIIR